ncbi:hypothetical protein ES705_20578 [subsurface metagenome]
MRRSENQEGGYQEIRIEDRSVNSCEFVVELKKQEIHVNPVNPV